MAGAVPQLWWFDRFDDRIGILPVVGELVHTEELNGEDTLEFECREVPAKGDRLLWLDGSVWREHVVVRANEPWRGSARFMRSCRFASFWTTSSRSSTWCRGLLGRLWRSCWNPRARRSRRATWPARRAVCSTT